MHLRNTPADKESSKHYSTIISLEHTQHAVLSRHLTPPCGMVAIHFRCKSLSQSNTWNLDRHVKDFGNQQGNSGNTRSHKRQGNHRIA